MSAKRGCNTPHKVIYKTGKAARLAAVSMVKQQLATQVRTYVCPAGHWHVTSKELREPAPRHNTTSTQLKEKH